MGTIASRARLTSQFQGAPNSGVAPIGDSAAPIWGLAPIGDFTGTDRSSPMDSCARSPNWLPPAPLVVPVHSHRFAHPTGADKSSGNRSVHVWQRFPWLNGGQLKKRRNVDRGWAVCGPFYADVSGPEAQS